VKKISVHRWPNVLVLHIKRFQDTRRKISTDVAIPDPSEYLDVTEYDSRNDDKAGAVASNKNNNNNKNNKSSTSTPSNASSSSSSSSPVLYKLFGITNHMGSLDGGHYTATTFHDSLRQWHEFSDADVREIGTGSVVKKGGCPYMLFYQRVK